MRTAHGAGIATAIDTMPDHFDNQGTDFHSLLREDIAAVVDEAPIRGDKLDYESLARLYPDQVSRIIPRSATDYLIGVVTPVFVFFMVFSVVWFLLDVRYVFTEVGNRELRIFGFCMVMGVVALNRLVARQGSEESLLYIVGLFAAVVAFTYFTTVSYGMGSVARGFLDNPLTATVLNFAIVAFLWWLTNRLTHECCVDTNPHAGDVGLLTSVARDFRERSAPKESAPARKKEKRPLFARPSGPVIEHMEIEPFDPTEWKPPEQKVRPKLEVTMAERPSSRHPGMSVFYFSIPVMIGFALGMPVLLQGGPGMVLAGHLYVGVYTFSALMLLLLSSLASLREYFRMRSVIFPAGIGWWWIGLGLAMIVIVLIGAISLPMPTMPGMAAIEEHETDYWTRGSTFELQQPASQAAIAVQESQVIDKVRIGMLVVLGIVAVFAALRGLGELGAWIGRNRYRFPRWMVRLFTWLDSILERVLKLPELPKFGVRRRISADVALSTQYRNPMHGQGMGSVEDVRAAVARSYEALCALAADLGRPKPHDMTPYEFLEVLPKEMRGLRDEARELTSLYVRSEYSDHVPDARVLDRLRRFWVAYEQVRHGLIR